MGRKKTKIWILLIVVPAAVLLTGAVYLYQDIKSKKMAYEERMQFYQSIAAAERDFILSNQLEDGALVMYQKKDGKNSIVPYFSNTAALALVSPQASDLQTQAAKQYIEWFLAHINSQNTDPVNGPGTIYDYTVLIENGQITEEISENDYDSVDSYTATFLTLLRAYYERTQDATFLYDHAEEIFEVTAALTNCISENGLSIVKQEYPIQYLMDNAEVNSGLNAMLYLIDQVYKTADAPAEISWTFDKLSALEAKNQEQIEALLWEEETGVYLLGLDKRGTGLPYQGWSTFYPDAVGQLFPINFDLLAPDSERAKSLYQRFCEEYRWETLDYLEKGDDSFYWCLLLYAGAQMQDVERVDTFLHNYQSRVANGRGYPFHIADAGWTALACDKMVRLYQEKIDQLDPLGFVK